MRRLKEAEQMEDNIGGHRQWGIGISSPPWRAGRRMERGGTAGRGGPAAGGRAAPRPEKAGAEAAVAAGPRSHSCCGGAAARRACVLLSGDTGFYAARRGLLPLLEVSARCKVVPGHPASPPISGGHGWGCTWQDFTLVSAHGLERNRRTRRGRSPLQARCLSSPAGSLGSAGPVRAI